MIDADTGIDDSIAILYALTSRKLHVEGITACFGNSGAVQSADNCLRLIKLSNCEYEVPVVIGANCTLDGELIIVTTGRLSNLAKALQKDPRLPKKVRSWSPWAAAWTFPVM